MAEEDASVVWKLIASVVIIVAAIPGLIIEPGPVSEMVAIGLLVAIWMGDESPGDAVQEATGVDPD